MDPFRSSDAVTYNKTDVEIARIREREETRRKRQEQPGYWLVRACGLATIVVACVLAACEYSAYLDSKRAPTCTETVEVIGIQHSARQCANGGWFDSKPIGGHDQVEVHCHCTPKPSETATAPSASAAGGPK